MSVPLGHKNHKSIRGSSNPRVYYTKPGYVYEVELIDNPILGRVYRLNVLDSSSSVRKFSERFIWKSPKWKKNALLTRTFNKVVPKYNEWENKGLVSLLVGNDGHLYTDGGETFYRVHDYEDLVERVIIPEGVKTIWKDAFQFSLVKQIYLPLSLKTISFASFAHTNCLEVLKIPSSNLDFSKEGGFLGHIKIFIPKGSYSFYYEQFKKSPRIELVEE